MRHEFQQARRRSLVGSWALIFLGFSAQASAPRVRYSAPAVCPSEADFTRAVVSRGGKVDDPRTGDGEDVLDVSIAEDDDGFHGSVQVRSGEHASNTRQVRGATCAEVVDALAVVSAMVLGQRTEETVADPSSEVTAFSAPSQQVAEASDPAVPAREPDVASHVLVTHSVQPGEDSGRKQIAPAKDRAFSELQITPAGGAAFGIVPGAMPRVDLSFARTTYTTMGGRSCITGPIIALSASLLVDTTFHSHGSSVDVGGQAITLRPCVAHFAFGNGFVFMSCLEVSAGMMGVRVTEPGGAKSESKTTGFGFLGGALELDYNFTRHMQATLRPGTGFLTNPIEEVAADGTQLYKSGMLVASAVLGLGARF